MEYDEKKDVEFYISKLQNLLSKVIAESEEFHELKKLVNSEDAELQLCVFSVLMDKNSTEFLKSMDISTLQKVIQEQMFSQQQAQKLDAAWSPNDVDFLKNLRIILP
jgi:hypothetical protein